MKRRWHRGSFQAAAAAMLIVACGESSPDLGSGSLRALTPLQYQASLRAIFGNDLPAQSLGPRTTSLASSTAGIGSTLVLAYETSSYEVVAWAFEEDEERRLRIAGCEPKAVAEDPCLHNVLGRLGRLAFRRTLTAEEVQRYVNLAITLGQENAWHGLAFAVAGQLQSPHFLYREELVDESDSSPRLTGTSIAARLSFLLWNEPPDDALLRAAETGALDDADGIADVAAGMLADPRADEGRRRLLAELFHTELLDEIAKDPRVFPEFNDALRADVAAQLEQTLSRVTRTGPLASVFTTRTVYLNSRLAALYGIEGTFGPELELVKLAADSPRAGVLTLPAILASRSYPGHTSVALRGHFVRQDLLCQDIPPPPPDVNPSLRPPTSGELVTTRELLAEHQSNETCWGCHSLMDPIGLALENFDAIGRYRDTQNGLPIDPSGELDGVPFSDARNLGQLLANHADLDDCFASNIFAYGTGRTLTRKEKEQLLVDVAAKTEGRLAIDEALLGIVSSELFASGRRQP